MTTTTMKLADAFDTPPKGPSALDRIADLYDDIIEQKSNRTWAEIAAALAKLDIHVTADTLKVYMHRLRRAAGEITSKVTSALFRAAEEIIGKPIRKRGAAYHPHLANRRKKKVATAMAPTRAGRPSLEEVLMRRESAEFVRPATASPPSGGLRDARGFSKEKEVVKDWADY
jgi:hypothetical protein